jgi:flagellar basal body-associated protein FliL
MKKALFPIFAILVLVLSCGQPDNGRKAAIDKVIKSGVEKTEATTFVDDAINAAVKDEGKNKKDAEKSVLENIDKLIEAKNAPAPSEAPVETVAAAAPVADTAVVKDLAYYDGITDINFTTVEDNPCAVIIKLSIGYKKSNAEAAKELTDKTYDVTETLRGFFSGKTSKDFANDARATLKKDVVDALNASLASKGVLDVKFDKVKVVKF